MKEPPEAKGRVVSTQSDPTDAAADKILTGSEATKLLGVPLPTIRRLVRDGSLRATSMANGAVGLKESEIRRFLVQSERAEPADLDDPESMNWLPRTAQAGGALRTRIQKASYATVEQPQLPKQQCLCGSCKPCQDAARWERVFQEKFADPDYYSRRVSRHGSSLSWLS
jgi:excisionase family DNA binding protein